jgi:hypothetical protein
MWVLASARFSCGSFVGLILYSVLRIHGESICELCAKYFQDSAKNPAARKIYHIPASFPSLVVDMLFMHLAGKRMDADKIALALLVMLFALSFFQNASAQASPSSEFLNSGCKIEGTRLNCSSQGLEERFGCYEITNASEALAGLDPRLPIVEGYSFAADRTAEGTGQEGLVRTGCMLAGYRNYIVKMNGDFQLIQSKDEFATLFAPVRSTDEAIAFAVALTDSFPLYDMVPPEGYFPVSSAIAPSSAEVNDGSFVVHLFDRPICGCSSHPYFAVDYLVTDAGNVTELSRRKVFDSNAMICFD